MVNRVLAVAGLGGVLTAPILIGYLHLITPLDEVNPVRRTISEYAFGETGWVFDTAVLALAAGSVAALVALVGTRLVPITSWGSVALLLWSVALTAVVIFPKRNFALGSTGTLHRVASVTAFLALPLAAVLIAWAWRRDPRWRRYATWTLRLGVLSFLCFSPILLAVVLEPVTGVRWWRAIPLGAVERALALAEVLTVMVLGLWAVRATSMAREPVLAEART